MPRKKISEHAAKSVLYAQMGQPYAGVELDTQESWEEAVEQLGDGKLYVVKVDQGVKGRFKKGLVKLGQTKGQLGAAVRELSDKGFRYLIVEEQLEHEASSERYLAFERARVGNIMSFSPEGGVDVESAADEIRRAPFGPEVAQKAAAALGVEVKLLEDLHQAFEDNYFSFLEINPLVVTEAGPVLLDAAVEVDTEAAFFVEGRWTPADFRSFETTRRTQQELMVEELAANSQASFRLVVLNPKGRIFLLLSGGGASVVLADEVFNQGHGPELANYGEYSGNPNAEETVIYTRQVLSLMLESPAPDKVLVIAGGVANFTDVRATFKGVIAALAEVKEQMREQGIKVFVRRGGPFEVEGLAMMQEFLSTEGLLGAVAGPEMMMSEIIPTALAGGQEEQV